LKGYLEKQKKKSGLCEAEALMFMRYIIEGYKELHAHKIIHRDIKPANILLKQGIAKLSDFGFSRVVPNTESSKLFTLLGTPLYTAPEILQSHEFSSKCDVWSVGIVFYEMLYAKTPWTGDNLTDLRDNILSTPLEFGN
jgi:serine/threonine protein kinase